MLNNFTLNFLDRFFLIFHSGFTLFNVFGWLWHRTRRAHLITMGLTAVSWFVFGFRYGWGYCFCTDWHWQVRQALGKPVTSSSYIHFLALEISGVNLNPKLVDTIVAVVYIFSLSATIFLNMRDCRRSRGK